MSEECFNRQRRRVVLHLLVVAASMPLARAASADRKLVRIGYLSSTSPKAHQHLGAAFLQGMRELGYVEGQNLHIDYRYAEGQFDRLSNLAVELVQLSPDVIVASTSPSARAAKLATSDIPIVIVGVADPVSQGLVVSLALPGGNVTGLSGQYDDLIQKMLELLNSILPKTSQVTVLVNPAQPFANTFYGKAQDAAQILGMKLSLVEARDPAGLDSAFAAIAQRKPTALITLPDPMFFLERKRIADFGARSRLPTIGGWREFAEVGGLMSYGSSPPESYKRAAIFVDKILKGARPDELPVEQPTRFELVINMKTAAVLGITIPQSILLRADELIE